VLNYLTLPATEGVEVLLVKFNLAWLAVHGTPIAKRGMSKILEARAVGSNASLAANNRASTGA
jgi:hypothetical protein